MNNISNNDPVFKSNYENILAKKKQLLLDRLVSIKKARIYYFYTLVEKKDIESDLRDEFFPNLNSKTTPNYNTKLKPKNLILTSNPAFHIQNNYKTIETETYPAKYQLQVSSEFKKPKLIIKKRPNLNILTTMESLSPLNSKCGASTANKDLSNKNFQNKNFLFSNIKIEPTKRNLLVLNKKTVNFQNCNTEVKDKLLNSEDFVSEVKNKVINNIILSTDYNSMQTETSSNLRGLNANVLDCLAMDKFNYYYTNTLNLKQQTTTKKNKKIEINFHKQKFHDRVSSIYSTIDHSTNNHFENSKNSVFKKGSFMKTYSSEGGVLKISRSNILTNLYLLEKF